MENNQISVNTFNKLAQQYQDKYMSLEMYDQTFECFIDLLPKADAKILELGCGPGNITRYLLGHGPDLKILGTDLAPKMVDLARTNNPQAEFQILDCRSISSISESFDAIMCGFCLPYLTKEEAASLIKDAAKLLNPGGVIYISTMEDDYGKSGLQSSSSGDEVFMYYHSSSFLQERLEEAGFDIQKLQRQDFYESDDTKSIDLFITAQLKKNSKKTPTE